MNKKTILIIAICAVVAIAGAVSATVILRNGLNVAEDPSEAFTTSPVTEGYVYDDYFAQDSFENITVNNDETETTPEAEVLTTLRQIVATTKKATDSTTKKTSSKTTTKKSSSKTTTKKSSSKTTTKKSGSTSYPGDDMLVDQVIGPNGNQFLGYRYDAEGDFYYTDDKDCWQSNAGYNEIYDNMAAFIMMNIDQVRIRFTYDHQDWMIQLWKGQYGNLLVGAEIGVYTAEEGTYTGAVGDVNHYNCADKEDWLKMEMTMYWKENNKGSYKKAFEREYDYYWWATGFVKGQLTKYTTPRTELKMKARITFKSTEMADLFVAGMKESGFARALGSNQLVDDSFYQKGADVWFLWTTKYHDCFVGYEG